MYCNFDRGKHDEWSRVRETQVDVQVDVKA